MAPSTSKSQSLIAHRFHRQDVPPALARDVTTVTMSSSASFQMHIPIYSILYKPRPTPRLDSIPVELLRHFLPYLSETPLCCLALTSRHFHSTIQGTYAFLLADLHLIRRHHVYTSLPSQLAKYFGGDPPAAIERLFGPPLTQYFELASRWAVTRLLRLDELRRGWVLCEACWKFRWWDDELVHRKQDCNAQDDDNWFIAKVDEDGSSVCVEVELIAKFGEEREAMLDLWVTEFREGESWVIDCGEGESLEIASAAMYAGSSAEGMCSLGDYYYFWIGRPGQPQRWIDCRNEAMAEARRQHAAEEAEATNQTTE